MKLTKQYLCLLHITKASSDRSTLEVFTVDRNTLVSLNFRVIDVFDKDSVSLDVYNGTVYVVLAVKG